MASSGVVKLACAIVVCMVIAAPNAEAAITCGAVTQNLAGCLPFLRGGAGPSAACCGGVKTLNGMAATTPDRKTACGCLKSQATQIPNLNLGNAAALAGKCGVNIPYKISPSTDCSKVV